ncbi:lipoprotein signal peptidase [Ramlibacter rhizophilus]|uniref:Lipoprotein signal peptidase n=1 Tax=Ramlibacter rhizophilus TaxID=1781167 RepID=A0A4Z0C072_9BURK|nr:lipoprotein signal peptidase [Ramlibacter rhizophilus]
MRDVDAHDALATRSSAALSERPRTALPWLALSACALAADFATKALVRARMVEGESTPLAPFFNLVSARNAGAAFSFLADAGGWQRHFFVALALVVSALLAWMLSAKRARLDAFAYSMILGGAVGNAIDRLAFGAVTDFLDFHWAGWHWPAFNVADVAICLGAACLVASSFKPSGAQPSASGAERAGRREPT